jgi:hypothetical protein
MDVGLVVARGHWGPDRVRAYRLCELARSAHHQSVFLLNPSQASTVPITIPIAQLDVLAIRSEARITVARGTSGTSEVQVLSITGGTPTIGSFTAYYGAAATSSIAYNASAAAVKTAVEASSAIGAGNVLSATGGPLPSSPITLTFATSLGNVANPTWGLSSLDAGSPNFAISVEGSAGSSSDLFTVQPTWPKVWFKDWASLEPCPFTADVSALTITNLASDRTTLVQILTAYGD